MNAQEKWSYIVKHYKQNYAKPESEIQKGWEDIFSEFFDYKKLCGEIVTQTYIQLGSRNALIPDIILKKGKEILADVELKQYTLPLDVRFENQLISYLKQLNLTIGVIICNKIYLYVFSYPRGIEKIEIPFEEENKRGLEFVELFNKNVFDMEMIREYVRSEKAKEEKQKDMMILLQEIKTKLNPAYIRDCVYECLLSDYPKDIVDSVLNDDITFRVETKLQQTMPGYDSARPQTGALLDFPETGDFLIIKTSDERVAICQGSLYDATRHCWNVRYDNVIRYKYVLAVIKGYVKEVYRVDEWHQAKQWEHDFKDVSNRYEFVGSVASEDIRQKWIGKLIPEYYRKKGMASPVVFSKPFAN